MGASFGSNISVPDASDMTVLGIRHVISSKGMTNPILVTLASSVTGRSVHASTATISPTSKACIFKFVRIIFAKEHVVRSTRLL